MIVLGINAYHGDASAAAVVDGRVIAAAEEERFTRVKHEAGFPVHALRYVYEAAGAPRQPICLAVARDPWARILRKAWHGLRMPRTARARLSVQRRFAGLAQQAATVLDLREEDVELRRVEHHAAHLASAFLVSPFDEAALLSVDGLGDFASAMWGVGRGPQVMAEGAVTFPHSLGIFYTALTQYLGFPSYGDEYKVMGLASYGEPEFLDELRCIVPESGDAEMGFTLALPYFVHHQGDLQMTWPEGEPRLPRLWSDHLARRLGPAREAEAPLERRHQNIAASMQRRLEEVLLERLRRLRRRTGLRALCLAGGVAFNCVLNGKIREQAGFDDVYVASAAGDAGLAIGAALAVWHQRTGGDRAFRMEHSYWGPEFDDRTIALLLEQRRGQIARAAEMRPLADVAQACAWAAEQLSGGKIVGWFQGRMEWGPRALGNRSILADPRDAAVRDVLNTKIKRRETFRPFAPAILEEATGEYFEESYPSPFMLMAHRVKPRQRSRIAAVTHVDGTGRLQSVSRAQNPVFHDLLASFRGRTGVPVLLNTSFNENEPIVCRPEEALACFLRTEMDALVLGRWVIERRRA